MAGREFADDEADSLTWDEADLKEVFGIPDVLVPVRLPDEPGFPSPTGWRAWSLSPCSRSGPSCGRAAFAPERALALTSRSRPG